MPFLQLSPRRNRKDSRDGILSADAAALSSVPAMPGTSNNGRGIAESKLKLGQLIKDRAFWKRRHVHDDLDGNISSGSSLQNEGGEEESMSLIFDAQQIGRTSTVQPSNTTISLGTGSFSTIDDAAVLDISTRSSARSIPLVNTSDDGEKDHDHNGKRNGKNGSNDDDDDDDDSAASVAQVTRFHASTNTEFEKQNDDDHRDHHQNLQVDHVHGTYYIRVADLHLEDDHLKHMYTRSTQSMSSSSSSSLLDETNGNENKQHNENLPALPTKHKQYYDYPSDEVPNVPALQDAAANAATERWIALNMIPAGTNNTTTDVPTRLSPIATLAMPRLVDYAMQLAYDADRWIPESKTKSILTKLSSSSSSSSSASWQTSTFQNAPFSSSENNSTTANNNTNPDVLIWTTGSQFNNNANSNHNNNNTTPPKLYHGHDTTAIRSAALIPMKSKDLYDLLLDSKRIQEYNKFSLGRNDVLVFDATTNTKSCTKITIAKSKPPVIRTVIEMKNVMHGTKTENGYIIVSRSVYIHDDDNHSDAASSGGDNILTVHLIVENDEDDSSCMLINITHLKPSSFIPQMVARRVGLMAATNFMHDIITAIKSS